MGKKIPGESGGRRKINQDKGSPRAGKGNGEKIKGSDVVFRTPGGKETGRGGFIAKLLRRSTDGGKHS